MIGNDTLGYRIYSVEWMDGRWMIKGSGRGLIELLSRHLPGENAKPESG
jgi:hypothetical protein